MSTQQQTQNHALEYGDSSHDEILIIGRQVIDIELAAVQRLRQHLDERFTRAVELILHSTGRLILTGIGKSGIIARKISATMTSVGTPAIFLHPVEGVHGDLGLVSAADVIIAISKSGETVELNRLMPMFRRSGCRIIAMTGNPDSQLARVSDVHLDISVTEEACPFDLAPTASTTAALVMGDALAIALLKMKKFQLSDFVRNHPGGSIGRSNLRVFDLMRRGNDVPVVREDAPIPQTLTEMTTKRLGMTAVVDLAGRLTGIITDGDLRRWLSRSHNPLQETAVDAMTRNPRTINGDALALDAVNQMEHAAITSLLITDEAQRPIGVIHLHDLVKSGIAYSGKGPYE